VGFGYCDPASQPGRRLSQSIGSACAELSLLAGAGAAAVISRMVAAANLVEVAALVGDTARATILAALMDGRALTGSELAYLAHISPPDRERASFQAGAGAAR
jgi:hypothetical protein